LDNAGVAHTAQQLYDNSLSSFLKGKPDAQNHRAISAVHTIEVSEAIRQWRQNPVSSEGWNPPVHAPPDGTVQFLCLLTVIGR
jgi:hypothetical protein